MLTETLVLFGGAVKALDDNGKVGGYLVRFSGPTDPDLTGDYFTSATDFNVDDWPVKTSVYYAHGLDKSLGQRKLGKASIKQDDTGLWVEAQLELRDQYERAIFDLAKQGKLGWSSGSASHLIAKKAGDKGSYEVTNWPLVEASLTPIPAEPRNSVTAFLKSLIDIDDSDGPQAGKKLSDHATCVLATASDYATRLEELKALRAQDKRNLSEVTRKGIADTASALGEIVETLKSLAMTPTEYADEEVANRLFAQFISAVNAI